MQLSPNFTLAEATASAAARALGDANQPTPAHLKNIIMTADRMEGVRALLGRAIHPTSWYRNPAVNRHVGGVPTSHHALGLAVDFRVGGMTGLAAGRIIAASDLQFDQLIWYRPSGILHLSFAPRMRRQVWTNPTTAAGAKLIVGLVP